MSRKVHTEKSYIDLFLSKVLPQVDVVPIKSEAPDFLIEIDGKTIGVEVTELNVPARGMPNRHVESMEDYITTKAKELLTQRGVPFLTVWLFFNIQQPLNADQKNAIAHDVAVAVERAVPEVGGHIELDYPFSLNSKPYGVDLIHISRHENARRQWWRVVKASRVLQNSLTLFQKAIDNKNLKYNSYREKCDECWLLLGWKVLSNRVPLGQAKKVALMCINQSLRECSSCDYLTVSAMNYSLQVDKLCCQRR